MLLALASVIGVSFTARVLVWVLVWFAPMSTSLRGGVLFFSVERFPPSWRDPYISTRRPDSHAGRFRDALPRQWLYCTCWLCATHQLIAFCEARAN